MADRRLQDNACRAGIARDRWDKEIVVRSWCYLWKEQCTSKYAAEGVINKHCVLSRTIKHGSQYRGDCSVLYYIRPLNSVSCHMPIRCTARQEDFHQTYCPYARLLMLTRLDQPVWLPANAHSRFQLCVDMLPLVHSSIPIRPSRYSTWGVSARSSRREILSTFHVSTSSRILLYNLPSFIFFPSLLIQYLSLSIDCTGLLVNLVFF